VDAGIAGLGPAIWGLDSITVLRAGRFARSIPTGIGLNSPFGTAYVAQKCEVVRTLPAVDSRCA
jgi:hypothetical protein